MRIIVYLFHYVDYINYVIYSNYSNFCFGLLFAVLPDHLPSQDYQVMSAAGCWQAAGGRHESKRRSPPRLM